MGLLAVALVLAGGDSGGNDIPSASEDNSVAEVVEASRNTGTLAGALQPAGLADVLDDVFFATDVPTTETALPTLEGSDGTVLRDGEAVTLTPNEEASSVVAPDVDVSNGVVHGVDTVLEIPLGNWTGSSRDSGPARVGSDPVLCLILPFTASGLFCKENA